MPNKPVKIKNINKKQTKRSTWKYHYFTLVYQKSRWYNLQFLRHRAWQTEICNFGSFFAIFTPLAARKINSFFKKEKTPGDIIIWQMWTKNYDHMIYCSRDMVHDRWEDKRRDGKSDIVGWSPKKYPKGWGASLMTACEGVWNLLPNF